MQFEELYSQDHVTRLLSRGLEMDRLSSSLLFYGPAGSGKRTAAFILAKILNCEQPGISYCDACPSCHRMNQFSHPDLHLLNTDPLGFKIEILINRLVGGWNHRVFQQADYYFKEWIYRLHAGFFPFKDRVRHNKKYVTKKVLEERLDEVQRFWKQLEHAYHHDEIPSVQVLKQAPTVMDHFTLCNQFLNVNSISIDAVRKVLGYLNKKPNYGKMKVFIFNDLHDLRNEATNAFLKGLEEPPPHNQIILITEDLASVLPTIRSRCFLIPFHKLNTTIQEQILSEKFGLELKVTINASIWDTLEGDLGKNEARKHLQFYFSKGITQFRRSHVVFDLSNKIAAVEGIELEWYAGYFLTILRLALGYKYKQIPEKQIGFAKVTIESLSNLPDIKLKALATRIDAYFKKVIRNNVNLTLVLENLFIAFGQLYLEGEQ